MRFALTGLFLMLGIVALAIYERTDSAFAALVASALAFCSIVMSIEVLKTYRGDKR